MKTKYYYKPKHKKNIWTFLIILITLPLLVETLVDLEILLSLMTLGVLGYGGYKFIKKGLPFTDTKKQLNQKQTTLRLQELKAAIRLADQEVTQAQDLLNEKAYTQYGDFARQLLPKVEHIQQEALALKNHLEPNIYRRIIKKSEEVISDITSQLQKLEEPIKPQKHYSEEDHVRAVAPEILTTYLNIKRDHETILVKIAETDNQFELRAMHDTNMKRFEDILAGYLKIKAIPKNFHNAEERLDKARKALEQFDLELDQTLRELNESDLADFEVSLRMMSKQTHDPLQDYPLD